MLIQSATGKSYSSYMEIMSSKKKSTVCFDHETKRIYS